MDNCIQTVYCVLKLLKVKFTSKYVKDSILSHPEYPSLLSISDIIGKFNIETLAIKIEEDKLLRLPIPFIVQVEKESQPLFYVVEFVGEKVIKYYDHMNQKFTKTRSEFLKLWTGVCLLVESAPNSKEEGIEQKLAQRRFQIFFTGSVSILFLVWVSFRFFNSGITNFNIPLAYLSCYFLIKLIGLGVGSMLLWFEVDQYNPMLQKICSGGANKKLNCNAVLSSKYASLFNGSISLSLLSFSYFFGSLLFLIIQGFSLGAIFLLGFLSFLMTPFLIFSFYSQAFIIKQWCKFCLAIQGILLLEILLVYWSGLYKPLIAFESIALLILLLILPVALWNPLKSLLKYKKEINVVRRGLSKIKNNHEVFKSLLNQSKKIKNTPDGLGIALENQKAKYQVLKVCNPYCGPCAEAHPVLEDLLSSGKISLQILFTAKDSKDFIGKPVAHFLAIASEGGTERIQSTLEAWYSSKEKNFEQFAKKHVVSKKPDSQDQKIRAMRSWCDKEEITFTPTIFINGYQLPKEYDVNDLKEILN